MASVTSYTLRILTSVFLTHISLFMSQSIYELTDVQCECQIWHVLKWISSFSLLPCPHQICSSSVFSTWWLIRISQLPKGESWEEPWYPHPFLNIFIQSVIKYCWLHFFMLHYSQIPFLFLQASGSQSVLPEPPALASPANLLAMLILESHLRHTE